MATETAQTVRIFAKAAAPSSATQLILCHGVFDLLHPGHVTHLRQARQMGDMLVVSITADGYVAKGPGRPIYTEAQRCEMLLALECVDAVAIVDGPSGVPAIQELKPAVYVKGSDYACRDGKDGKLTQERKAVEAVGGRLAYTDSPLMSSTSIINAQRERPIKASMEEVFAWLDKAKTIKAALFGEHITDWYTYVEPVGKAPKEELIVYREVGDDTFQGGTAIIQAHLLEAVGEVIRYPSKPIVKHRYISRPFMRKLYEIVHEPWQVPAFDTPAVLPNPLVVIADFGHGHIPPNVARNITKLAQFLAITCQSNGLNWGFNLLTKWPRADYFVVDEQELRLAASDRFTPLDHLLEKQIYRLGAKVGAVTLGHKGCMIMAHDGPYKEMPALTDKVVDRMGAGDAFLAWSAPLAYLGAPAEIVGFIGNVAAGIKVGMVGNQPVTAKKVREWVKGLLG